MPDWAESRDKRHAWYEAPTADDAVRADGMAFGTSPWFGNISAELKAYINSPGGLWFQGKLNGKVGAVFTSTSSPCRGNETTDLSMQHFMAHLGLIISRYF